MIDKVAMINRVNKNNFYLVPSSVTKLIRFMQRFCFLSNIINCQEQLKKIQQTKKKKNVLPFWGFPLCYKLLY